LPLVNLLEIALYLKISKLLHHENKQAELVRSTSLAQMNWEIPISKLGCDIVIFTGQKLHWAQNGLVTRKISIPE
jgi:hypothetical protein